MMINRFLIYADLFLYHSVYMNDGIKLAISHKKLALATKKINDYFRNWD